MRGCWKNLVVVLLVLAVTGWLRMPYEQALTVDMQEQRLLPPSFDLKSHAALKQKSFAAAFGSFRPTLAALMAVGATQYHTYQQWDELERSYEEIVLLDPFHEHYWEMGGWHLAYNAAAEARENMKLSELERERLFRAYIEKGNRFFERGIEANPDSWKLRASKAKLWASPFRIRDFPMVNRTLKELLAMDVGMSKMQRDSFRRELLYSLIRTSGHEQEAYELALTLFREGEQNHFPSLLNALMALQMNPQVTVSQPLSVEQIYGDAKSAYKNLRNYLRAADGYAPVFGVRPFILKLESQLNIPDNLRLDHASK